MTQEGIMCKKLEGTRVCDRRTKLSGLRFILSKIYTRVRYYCRSPYEIDTKADPEGMLARWLSVLDVYDFEIQHRAGIKHANADGLTRTDCTQCKRNGCAGRGMGLGESRILQLYKDTLDLHEQHDIQDDIVLLQLPTPKGKEGLSELEKFVNITRRVHTSSELNWLGLLDCHAVERLAGTRSFCEYG